MKRIFAVLTLLIPFSAFAVFSAFVVVNPGTEHEKKFNFKVAHAKNLETCTIEFNSVGYDYKQAWLVVSSRPLSNTEQELRGFIWGESPKPISVELFVKLSPINNEKVDEKSAKNSIYKVTLKSELASRSYVYIDFPHMVFDGGYYYSIPLGDYCGKNNQHANKALQPTQKPRD